ncbi:MAG: hypothetical protein ACRD2W_24190 [Acidimicrobiales bacterium]
MDDHAAQLHNVTVYVAREQFDEMRDFYARRLGLPVVFEEAGHLCCFAAGRDLAICIHEAEPGHRAGARELFLWIDDQDDGPEVHLVDPVGNQVRLHGRRD